MAAAVALVVVAALAAAATAAGPPLGAYWVNMSDVTVSGLSAGAYMAVQFHVAFSATVRGAASIAGGPYYCARGSVSVALTTCMTTPGGVNLGALYDATDGFAAEGAIDDPAHLQGAPVYLFAGTRDTTVDPQLSHLLEEYYTHYGAVPLAEYGIAAGHAHITDDFGNACSTSDSPYINDCGYDAAGQLLAHVRGRPLAPRQAVVPEHLLTFDQAEFGGRSLDGTGFVYVPAACQAGGAAPCGVHIAFHGCLQARSNIGDVYAERAGYNAWAEANQLIVLYPQAIADVLLGNPNACFDWWGYADRDYAVQAGSQMAAVRAMLERLASGGPALAPPTGLRVVNTTDDSVTLTWTLVELADHYVVRRDGAVAADGVLGVPYTVTGLPSGSTFTFTVQAATAAGAVSAPSEPVTASTTGPPPPLTAPQNVHVTATTASTVALAWDGVAGAAGYRVTRDGGAAVLNTTAPEAVDAGLAPETTYTYVVAAVSASGTVGPASAPVSATTRSAFECQSYEDSNYNHVAKDRAYAQLGYAYAIGSDDLLGLYNTFYRSTVSEISPGYFVEGACP